MDTIGIVRQMMAEQKFSEAIKQIEFLLRSETTARYELLILYYEVSQRLEKPLPYESFLELVKIEIERKNYSSAEKLLSHDVPSLIPQVLVDELKILILDEQGKLHDLYQKIKGVLLTRLQNKNPIIPKWIHQRIEKYFKTDFGLKLISLSSLFVLGELEEAERLTKALLFQSVEKQGSRDVQRNITLCLEVLETSEAKAQFDIYLGYCQIYLNGIREKKDFKRLIEMAIYFDEFKLQVIFLDLLLKLNLLEEARLYSEIVRSHEDYNFIYFDKYFKHLKDFFLPRLNQIKSTNHISLINAEDLTIHIEKIHAEALEDRVELDSPDEEPLINFLKYQDFDFNQLCDLAVSFLQSEMLDVALMATEKAIQQSLSDKDFLKASYLKMTCLLMRGEHRAVIDVGYYALKRADSKEDILSFLYGQAEAFMKLGKKSEAKKVLMKIVAIDETYRLAKMRLEKLNEV